MRHQSRVDMYLVRVHQLDKAHKNLFAFSGTLLPLPSSSSSFPLSRRTVSVIDMKMMCTGDEDNFKDMTS